MSALEGIGIDSAIAAEANRRASEDEIGQSNFLQMLVAQLENQDPLNPQDSAAFAAQLAQFSSVEQLIAVRAGIDQLVAISAGTGTGTGGGATSQPPSSLDPTSLIGKEVVVFGSQIEVDAQQSEIVMPFRSIDPALEATVAIYNAENREVYRGSVLPFNSENQPTYLPAGNHEFRFDPSEHNLPPGAYGIEFTAVGQGERPVTLLPTVEGLVTGAILAGDPAIRIGNRIFSVSDVLEVRLRGDEPRGTTGNSPEPVITGGGQTVLRPPTWNSPDARPAS